MTMPVQASCEVTGCVGSGAAEAAEGAMFFIALI